MSETNKFEGWEIDNENSTDDRIVLKKKEPKWTESWGGLSTTERKGWTINIKGTDTHFCHDSSLKLNYPTEKHAKSALALAQLLMLRQQIVGDWEPDWSSRKDNWAVRRLVGIVDYIRAASIYSPLSFQNKTQVEWFLKQHSALLRVYYMID